jgi:hypothetical protein
MRFANHFNPEWGYLAPAPSFARTVRIVLIAAAVGATAGAAVVLSLVERPGAEESSVAARTLVEAADSAVTVEGATRVPQVGAPQAARFKSVTQSPLSAHAPSAAASESTPSSTIQSPVGVAGLAEAPAAVAAALPEAATASDAITAQKKAAKKQRLTWRRGPLALLPYATIPGTYGGGAY